MERSQPPLLQDCDKGLSQWLATRLGAKELARQAAKEIEAQRRLGEQQQHNEGLGKGEHRRVGIQEGQKTTTGELASHWNQSP